MPKALYSKGQKPEPKSVLENPQRSPREDMVTVFSTSYGLYEPMIWIVAADRVLIKQNIGHTASITFPCRGVMLRMSGDPAFFRLECFYPGGQYTKGKWHDMPFHVTSFPFPRTTTVRVNCAVEEIGTTVFLTNRFEAIDLLERKNRGDFE